VILLEKVRKRWAVVLGFWVGVNVPGHVPAWPVSNPVLHYLGFDDCFLGKKTIIVQGTQG